jgi:hypothetical protein
LHPALDGEIGIFQHSLGELEAVFEFREECIALDQTMHAGEVEFAAAWQHLLIDFATACDPDGFVGVR